MTRFVVFFGALAVVWACSGDPTKNQGTPTTIVTNPAVVFVAQGDSEPVIVSVVDEDGQALEAEFTATDVGSGITVIPDPNFLPVSSGRPIGRSARFFVRADELAASQFSVQALGLTKVVTVTSIPPSLAATFSTTTPALGDTVTLTAPTGTFFTDTTVVTIGGGQVDIVSKDATTIVFVPGPNIADLPVLLTNVGVTSNPSLVFNLATSQTIKTDSITDIGAALSPTTPTLGQTVTLTLPAGIRVVPESAQGLTIAAAVPGPAPLNIVVAGDSGSITFVPPPNADSFVVVPGVIAQRLPQYPLLLSTTAKVTTPVVTAIPSTVSSTTPAGGAAVTLTSTDGSFTFADNATVTVGGQAAFTTTVSGASMSFVPQLGSTGAITVNGAVVVGFPLTLLSTAPSITAGATAAAKAGTGSPGTAPTIELPAAGSTRGFIDAVPAGYAGCGDIGVDCQVYKFTLAADQDFDVAALWEGTSDVGIYFLESDGVTQAGDASCDANGNGAAGGHEECTQSLTAGTYFLAVVPFGPLYTPAEALPAWVTVNLTGE
ncbi:MAG: pre-peptidase C-terminal domain-containing protein [Gemmatimonadales bacterium]